MFRTQARDAEGIAAATWHEFLNGLSATRNTASGRAKDLSVDARDRFFDVGAEARRRATSAIDVLAGRPVAPPRWPLVLGAAVGGALLGWAASQFVRRHPMDETLTALSAEASKAKAAVEEGVGKAKLAVEDGVSKAKSAVGNGAVKARNAVDGAADRVNSSVN